VIIWACEQHQEAIVAQEDAEMDALIEAHYREERHDDPA
jgi:hypothetical protein